MKLLDVRIGLGITGSFCNFNQVSKVIDLLKQEGVNYILPVVSYATKDLSTRFYKNDDFIKMLEERTGNKVFDSIVKSENIGPKDMIDVMLVCPCTGNTVAKLANSIIDTPVLMAVKAHLRNNKPVVLGISTNDGLGSSLENIGKLLNTKNVYFVPFRQDDYIAKPKSLALDYSYIIDTIKEAIEGKQIQPIISNK